MKAKNRRRLERLAEQERKECGLPILDVRKLIATNDVMRKAVLDAAKIPTPTDKGFVQDLIMEQQEQG